MRAMILQLLIAHSTAYSTIHVSDSLISSNSDFEIIAGLASAIAADGSEVDTW